MDEHESDRICRTFDFLISKRKTITVLDILDLRPITPYGILLTGHGLVK